LLEGKGTDRMIPLLNERGISFSGPFSSLEALITAFKNDVFAGKICAGKFAGTGKSANGDAASATSSSATTGNPTVNVVFSPGATSFGMFTNEFDRGRKFKKLVQEIFTENL
ncbi:MAG: hypothetical protein J5631_11045, partial [Spirochaetaceae bacterium]|nr:hypothetical protein [Spirochaetaceae bacterium]